MKNKTNQTIRDGLVVTVVGGLIFAGLTYLVQRYYKLFFDWLGLITDSVKQYLQSTTTISFWIIWLVILLLLALIIFTIKNTKSKKSSKILLPESYIQQLQQEISRLKAQDAPMLADLAGIDDEVTISGKYLSTSHGRREMSRTLSWKEVFSSIVYIFWKIQMITK